MSANVKTGIVPVTKRLQYNRFSAGDWLYWKCEYEKARVHFQGILKQPGLSELDRARCYKSLAAVELALKNYDEAVKNYKDQLEILIKLYSSIDNKEEIAKCLISIGKVFWLKLDYVQAIAYHDRALHSAATASRRLISTVYKNMANIYTNTTEFDKAEYYFRKAIEFDQQNFPQEHPQFGQIYANMGIMYSLKDDHKQALIYFTQARETWLKSFPATHLYIQKMENTIRDTQSKLVSAQLAGVIPSEKTAGAAMANKTPQSTNLAAAAGGLPNILDSIAIKEKPPALLSDSAAHVLSNHQLPIICWCDSTNSAPKQKVETLSKYIKEFKYVTDDKLFDYISNQRQNKIFLIISGAMGRQTVHAIENLEQIYKIYIYCYNIEENQQWAQHFEKVGNRIFNVDNLLIDRLEKDLLAFVKEGDIYSTQDYTITKYLSLDNESAERLRETCH